MGVPIWKINSPDGLMDGWALKCFSFLVCLCDEMCGLDVLRDDMDEKQIEGSYCKRVSGGETVRGLLFALIPGPRWATR